MLLGLLVRPRRERVRQTAAGLVAGFDVVPGTDERIEAKWGYSGDAVDIQRESGRSRVERELHLHRINVDEARRLLSLLIDHVKSDAIPRVDLDSGGIGGRNG